MSARSELIRARQRADRLRQAIEEALRLLRDQMEGSAFGVLDCALEDDKPDQK